jgi:UDP-glucose-4-epimerase GalE
MRILITGGAGYIGSHTARRLHEKGHEVWVLDNLSTGHRAAVGAALRTTPADDRLLVGDLLDTPFVDHVFVERRIEAVVHFAASALVGESVRRPELYYRNNTVASLNLMDLMRRHGVGRFVFSSTCAVYGVPPRVPITEDETPSPINPYGNSKLAVEHAFRDHASAFGWGGVMLRYFNAAGASHDGTLGEDHDPESHLVPLVIGAALQTRPPIQILGTNYPTPDGSCVRDYIHIEDIAEAHVLALEKVEPGSVLCCNLGTGKGNSVREVIRAVEEVSGRPVPFTEGPPRPGDPPVLVARADRAWTLLGWRPRYPELHGIIETAWRWHRDHPHGYAD